MKNSLTAAALAAALALAGCGGGDSNQALSYDEFGEELSSICSASNEDRNATFSEVQQEITEENLGELIKQDEAIVADARELDPPAELEAAFTDYTSSYDEIIAKYKEGQEAIAADDTRTAQKVLTQADVALGQRSAAASKLGAGFCLPGGG